MIASYAESLSWIVVVIHVVGLFSAWFARLSEGSHRQTQCQWLFLACLALVGVATLVASSLGAGIWLLSGATLSLMVLAAVYDSRDSAYACRV